VRCGRAGRAGLAEVAEDAAVDPLVAVGCFGADRGVAVFREPVDAAGDHVLEVRLEGGVDAGDVVDGDAFAAERLFDVDGDLVAFSPGIRTRTSRLERRVWLPVSRAARRILSVFTNRTSCR
jgi:hypothetical protein